MNDDSAAITGTAKPLEKGLSIAKAAEILDYCPDTIRRMLHSGELDGYGSGKKLRIYESSIVMYRRKERVTKNRMPTVRENIRRTGTRHREAVQQIAELLR